MTNFENFPLVASFVAGIITFVSPCILPLIPAFISFIAGKSLEELKDKAGPSRVTFLHTLFFVLGFTFVFTLLGASASYLGNLAGQYKDFLRWFGGIVIILFGLHISGILKIPLLYREKRMDMRKVSFGYFSSFLFGVAFSIGWTPCVGPILASILILASTQETVYKGMLLLTVYSFGLGIPFLITALFVNWAMRFFTRIKAFFKVIEIIAGVILIILGILLITDNLQLIAAKLLG